MRDILRDIVDIGRGYEKGIPVRFTGSLWVYEFHNQDLAQRIQEFAERYVINLHQDLTADIEMANR